MQLISLTLLGVLSVASGMSLPFILFNAELRNFPLKTPFSLSAFARSVFELDPGSKTLSRICSFSHAWSKDEKGSRRQGRIEEEVGTDLSDDSE